MQTYMFQEIQKYVQYGAKNCNSETWPQSKEQDKHRYSALYTPHHRL
jgi:hypothetical protein